MTPELESMLESERHTIRLWEGSLQKDNPDMQSDYRARDWQVLFWEVLACVAMVGSLFLLGGFK